MVCWPRLRSGVRSLNVANHTVMSHFMATSALPSPGTILRKGIVSMKTKNQILAVSVMLLILIRLTVSTGLACGLCEPFAPGPHSHSRIYGTTGGEKGRFGDSPSDECLLWPDRWAGAQNNIGISCQRLPGARVGNDHFSMCTRLSMNRSGFHFAGRERTRSCFVDGKTVLFRAR